MILSSYLRELSVEANKRRNNNSELLKLVPKIQYQSSKIETLTEKKVFPKKEIKMKKKKGLIEIVEKEEIPKKNDKVEEAADIQEGADIVEEVIDNQEGGDIVEGDYSEQEGGKDIKKIVIT